MTDLFMIVATMKLLQRGTKGMGTQSPDSTYIENGYYPVIDTPPTYDDTLEYLTYAYVLGIEVCNKVYTIVPYTDEELADKQVQRTKESVSQITVSYKPENDTVSHVFKGDTNSQNGMVTTMGKIKGQSPNKTQNWFDVNNVKVKLTAGDFEAILALIEPIQESLTDI